MEYYLGETLKKLRQERGWSQKELANRLNKAVSTISGYESDAHPIPLDVLISISLSFNISLDELVGIEKGPCISLTGLSDFQIEILKSLRNEYLSPTNCGGDLSASQMQILHDIIKAFVETHAPK